MEKIGKIIKNARVFFQKRFDFIVLFCTLFFRNIPVLFWFSENLPSTQKPRPVWTEFKHGTQTVFVSSSFFGKPILLGYNMRYERQICVPYTRNTFLFPNIHLMFENEKVVEIKNCKHCQASFEITDKDLDFYEKVSPVFPLSQPFPQGEKGGVDIWDGNIKYFIPSPTFCSDCRQQRRLSFRNERKLYKRKCDATWNDIISIYSPDKPYKVYDWKEWWNDTWNPLDYWVEFDGKRWFFQQFDWLMKKVPLVKLITFWENINSDYCNYVMWLKNCYLEHGSIESEDCMYGHNNGYSKNLVDTYFSVWNYVYEWFLSKNIHNSRYIYHSENITGSSFIYNSQNLLNCFLCCNIKNKQYCISNQQYSKEEYTEKMNSIHLWNYTLTQVYQKEFHKLILQFPQKHLHILNCENCSWDFLENGKNLRHCYYLTFWENHDNSFCYESFHIQNCSDVINSWFSNHLLEGYNYMNTSKSIFSYHLESCTNILYSTYLVNCNFCFWCIWLRNKSYCILNKQYTKEEYEKLVPKIIEHMKKTEEWWEFFPSSISPFWYNETVALEYFPLSKEEVLKQWFHWSDYKAPFPKVEKIIPASKLPDDLSKIPDDILNRAIECEVTKKPFRIISQELEFYRKHNIPIPKRHPNQRHLDRMKLRNPRKLFDRKCIRCWKDIQTTYSPDRKEIVYCESCYEKELY